MSVHWAMFLVMAIVALVRGWFYYRINIAAVHGRSAAYLIPLSRWLAEFGLIVVILIAIGALVYYYVNIRVQRE